MDQDKLTIAQEEARREREARLKPPPKPEPKQPKIFKLGEDGQPQRIDPPGYLVCFPKGWWANRHRFSASAREDMERAEAKRLRDYLSNPIECKP